MDHAFPIMLCGMTKLADKCSRDVVGLQIFLNIVGEETVCFEFQGVASC
jgi:hypothetical protein